MACSLFCYIKFYKQRYHEFCKPWWTWLLLTGVFLSLTISCKMVGLFTFLTIGMAVAIDLWGMLDIRRGHPMVCHLIDSSQALSCLIIHPPTYIENPLVQDHISRHFMARFIALIIVPIIVYLFWFWVHFTILTHSGTGDEFMTSAFQETLIGSPLNIASEGMASPHYLLELPACIYPLSDWWRCKL